MSAPSLWQFSLAVYAAPGVAEICLDLQARHGADVNLLLGAAWLGVGGAGIDPAEIAALDRDVAAFRAEVVARLRAARTWLKGELGWSAGVPALRERIKQVELQAERCEQEWLEARLAPSRRNGAAATSGAVDAYLRHLGLSPEARLAMLEGPLGTAIARAASPAQGREKSAT